MKTHQPPAPPLTCHAPSAPSASSGHPAYTHWTLTTPPCPDGDMPRRRAATNLHPLDPRNPDPTACSRVKEALHERAQTGVAPGPPRLGTSTSRTGRIESEVAENGGRKAAKGRGRNTSTQHKRKSRSLPPTTCPPPKPSALKPDPIRSDPGGRQGDHAGRHVEPGPGQDGRMEPGGLVCFHTISIYMCVFVIHTWPCFSWPYVVHGHVYRRPGPGGWAGVLGIVLLCFRPCLALATPCWPRLNAPQRPLDVPHANARRCGRTRSGRRRSGARRPRRGRPAARTGRAAAATASEGSIIARERATGGAPGSQRTGGPARAG